MTAISLQRGPKTGDIETVAMLGVARDRMSFFCRLKGAAGQPDKVGVDALQIMIAKVKADIDKNKKITLAAVRNFTMFEGLLSDEEKELTRRWTEEILGGGGGGGRNSPPLQRLRLPARAARRRRLRRRKGKILSPWWTPCSIEGVMSRVWELGSMGCAGFHRRWLCAVGRNPPCSHHCNAFLLSAGAVVRHLHMHCTCV